MKISVYDENMDRTAYIGGQFLSVLWSEGYNTVEPFTLELRATEALKKAIRPECYIGRQDRKTLMVIKSVVVAGGRITASGKQAARCLDDVSFVGTISKGLPVAGSIHNAFALGGGYPGFSIKDTGPEDPYEHQISNKSILELALNMCQGTDQGFRTLRGSKGITVEFYKPEEKPNLKYSETLGNLTVEEILLSTEKLKNHAIVLGAGEGEERAKAEVDQSNGGRKFSLIVDARDITREETDTDESYREKLEARGMEKLRERSRTWECAFQPLASDFGSKFDLGDILSVLLNDYGIKLKARVARFTQKEQNNQTETTIEVGNITIVR